MKSLFCLMSIFFFTIVANALPLWKGEQRAVVILLEWADTPKQVTVDEFRKTFFTDKDSLNNFFRENSHGGYSISGEVMDWRKSSLNWDPVHSCELGWQLDEAWEKFGHDIDIKKYDSDHNGKIDHLFIIHSGRINSDRVGPDCVFLDSDYADNTIIFQQKGLGSIGEKIPIGFYVHEAGHQFMNFPDLYGDHYNGQYGIAMWGMMGLGCWGVRNDIQRVDLFRYPSHFEPLSKVKIGWIKPKVINTTTKRVELKPIEEDGDIVVVPISNGENYYLEYRSEHGFSTKHRGHGLLIWKNYDLIQADGRDDLNHGTPLGHRPLPPISENFGDASDPFPGSMNIVKYHDSGDKVYFENISQENDRIYVDIVIKGPPVDYEMPKVPGFDGVEKL